MQVTPCRFITFSPKKPLRHSFIQLCIHTPREIFASYVSIMKPYGINSVSAIESSMWLKLLTEICFIEQQRCQNENILRYTNVCDKWSVLFHLSVRFSLPLVVFYLCSFPNILITISIINIFYFHNTPSTSK